MASDWQPGASSQALKARDLLLRTVRAFFQDRSVIEVQTPLLGSTGVADPHIENISLEAGSRTWYLQTSPEYAMKRLLAAGSGAIYQVCPAVRGAESGVRHNIEFTMLEWYRPGFGMEDLVAETASLVEHIRSAFDQPAEETSTTNYRALFERRYGINPHTADDSALRDIARDQFGEIPAHIGEPDAGTVNDLLDYLFSLGIQASLDRPTIVVEYPASQVALAEILQTGAGDEVAGRFELYWHGIELANGYQELCDAVELENRMAANNALRRHRGLPEVAPDHKLIDALSRMPPCAGVALGIDRLLMVLLGADSLDAVMSFSDERI